MFCNKLIKSAFFLPAAVLLTACGADDEARWVHEDDVVLVEVGGEPVTKAMLEVVMENGGVGEDDTERMRELLDGLIRLQVVANAAEQQGLSDDPKVRAERRIADLRVQNVRFLDRYREDNPVTEGDIQRAYREQVERSGRARYRIEAVPFEQQSEALAALDAVERGERDFADVVAVAEASGATVVRPDWIDLSQVPASFAESLEEAEAGEVLPVPQAMGDSWLAVRVLAIDDLEPPPLADVREGIRRTLTARQGEALVEELFQGAEIVPMLPMTAADPEVDSDREPDADGPSGDPSGARSE
ncbi:peptidyl-prolyl cis-trans isomerase [Halomonas denitrificans]|nr:peptidyl-prolyl cis-trans isomerase [Halomonas denitrificans]